MAVRLKTTINQIMSDTDIDRDDRVISFESFLSKKGLKYDSTRMSSRGGVRLYTSKDTNVEIMRQVGKRGEEIDKPGMELQWCILQPPNFKELGCGKGLNMLKNKL